MCFGLMDHTRHRVDYMPSNHVRARTCMLYRKARLSPMSVLSSFRLSDRGFQPARRDVCHPRSAILHQRWHAGASGWARKRACGRAERRPRAGDTARGRGGDAPDCVDARPGRRECVDIATRVRASRGQQSCICMRTSGAHRRRLRMHAWTGEGSETSPQTCVRPEECPSPTDMKQ